MHNFTLPGAHALVGEPAYEAAGKAQGAGKPLALHAGQSEPIRIEVATGARLDAVQADWLDLLARADCANVFMTPVLVRLASEHDPARRCCALLAWRDSGERSELVGLWAFAIGRAPQSIVPIPMLTAPPMPHAYLATPVIDRDRLDGVLEAMLSHIAGDASLPKIVALKAMGTDTVTMQALSRVLAARGGALQVFARALRPKLASDLDGKSYMELALSASSRKKLRQHRRRLAKQGALRFCVLTEEQAVRRGFEEFLKLEAAGWKGRKRTALLAHASDADFTRAMIATLAGLGQAAIHALTLDERPVSMQIVFHAGAAAFTWKTAYDEHLHDFSPGVLLFEDYTAAFLADGRVAQVDSCALDDSGYMATWTERAEIAQLWFNVRPGRSPGFALLGGIQAFYLSLRKRAKAIYRRFAQARRRRADESRPNVGRADQPPLSAAPLSPLDHEPDARTD